MLYGSGLLLSKDLQTVTHATARPVLHHSKSVLLSYPIEITLSLLWVQCANGLGISEYPSALI